MAIKGEFLVTDRRTFVKGCVAIGVAGIGGLSGCSSFNKMVGPRTSSYTDEIEEVSSLLISGDGRHLVFITSKWHYVFDAPPALVTALRSSYKPLLTATINRLDVDAEGASSVPYQIQLPNPSSAQAEQAQVDGFRYVKGLTPPVLALNGKLNGRCHASKGVQAAPSVALNHSYKVAVRRETGQRQFSDLPTPVRATAAGGLMLVMTPLVLVASVVLVPVTMVVLSQGAGGIGVGPR